MPVTSFEIRADVFESLVLFDQQSETQTQSKMNEKIPKWIQFFKNCAFRSSAVKSVEMKIFGIVFVLLFSILYIVL